MSDFPFSRAKYSVEVSIFMILALMMITAGCRSSKQATISDGFFEPLKSIDRPAPLRQSTVADAQKPSSPDQFADSLLNRQREHERRIGVLTGQLQLLETSRRGNKADSSLRGVRQSPSKPDIQPTPGKFEEFSHQYETGQYKRAAEGFQGLLEAGVTKDVEDQCRYMIGLSYFNLRRFDLASASLKIVADRKGSKLRADAYFVLGQTYRQVGASRQAKTMFESVLRESPKPGLAEAARNELKGLAAKK